MEPRGGFAGRAAGRRFDLRTGSLDGPGPDGEAELLDSCAHTAIFYHDAGEYADEVGGFIRRGLATRDPVLVAVPRKRALRIREALGAHADRITFTDMATLGRNPGRIISAIHEFAESHDGHHVWCVVEPVWPHKTAAERTETMRYETLINVAFADQRVHVLCPYDAEALDPVLLAEAERVHPALIAEGRAEANHAYAGPSLAPEHDSPLPDPPADVDVLSYRDEPATARAFVRDRARRAGLREPRITDLVIAVGELAANTLRHTRGGGTLRVWGNGLEVICEVRDSGHIKDALAGQRHPPADASRGHGLWVVHQVCDLVEIRTGQSGTVFRLHMALGT